MAMTREQLSELMSAYLDGEVDPRERAVVEAALRADPSARRLLEELRQTAVVVAALPRHAAPPNLAMNLDALLERDQLLSDFRANVNDVALRKPWSASLRAAAMLAVVLGGGWWFLSSQQEQRPGRLASAPPREAIELGSDSKVVSTESSKPTSPSIEAESLIASGADPVLLVKQSFEPEPIRLRIIARNEVERDSLTKQFTTLLAVTNTENLAHREALSEKKQPVGAFYLEGTPGINFANAHEKQILVRLPQAHAQRIVDDVLAGGKVHADQLALQVGPAVVRGPEKARGLLQIMAENDQPAQPGPDIVAGTFTDSQVPSPSKELLDTLGIIVGLGPVMQNPPSNHLANRTAMASSEVTNTENGPIAGTSGATSEDLDSDNATADDRVAIAEKAEIDGFAEPSAHRSLVAKRLEIARARREQENAGGSNDVRALRTQPPSSPSTSSPSAADQFITIVIEFAIPESKPPARTNVSRTRS